MPFREKKLARSFYNRSADHVASDLLGKIIVHHVHRREVRARIVETEAYVGQHDLACHAAKGRTNRTEVMFGPAGHAYVYLIYGMYDMFNIVCSHINDAQAVLVRAAEPLVNHDASLSGPGRFARAMSITRRDNALDLTGDRLYLLDDGFIPAKIVRTRRIGIDYAGKWKDELLRYVIADNPYVSALPGRNKPATRK